MNEIETCPEHMYPTLSRAQFRQYLLDGIDAGPMGKMDAAYFAMLRERLKDPTPRTPISSSRAL